MDYLEIRKHYLKHYGVKGMKWGVRKNEEPKTAKTKARAAEHDKALSDAKANVARIENQIQANYDEADVWFRKATKSKQEHGYNEREYPPDPTGYVAKANEYGRVVSRLSRQGLHKEAQEFMKKRDAMWAKSGEHYYTTVFGEKGNSERKKAEEILARNKPLRNELWDAQEHYRSLDPVARRAFEKELRAYQRGLGGPIPREKKS